MGKIVVFFYLVIPFNISHFISSLVIFISITMFKIILVSCVGTLVCILQISSEPSLLMEFIGIWYSFAVLCSMKTVVFRLKVVSNYALKDCKSRLLFTAKVVFSWLEQDHTGAELLNVLTYQTVRNYWIFWIIRWSPVTKYSRSSEGTHTDQSSFR
jgi:hypothetical protein